MKTFEPKDRVKVLVGEEYCSGSVNYVRMAHPNYSTPEVYSILLDKHFGRNGYSGSIYSADKVFPED